MIQTKTISNNRVVRDKKYCLRSIICYMPTWNTVQAYCLDIHLFKCKLTRDNAIDEFTYFTYGVCSCPCRLPTVISIRRNCALRTLFQVKAITRNAEVRPSRSSLPKPARRVVFQNSITNSTTHACDDSLGPRLNIAHTAENCAYVRVA